MHTHKAYDCINRDILFTKLSKIGISEKIYQQALLSIYKDIKCYIRLNGMRSEWFFLDCGLKQGLIFISMNSCHEYRILGKELK